MPTPPSPDAEPEQRGHDRDRHRDHRTERDEQHDHRDGETDVLAAVDLDVDQRAGELGLDAVFAGDVGCFSGLFGMLALDRVDRVVDGREAGTARRRSPSGRGRRTGPRRR